MYKVLSDPNDCIALQEDIHRFKAWCRCNGMHINSSKCSLMVFSRRTVKTNFQYLINGTTLPAVVNVSDLGVALDDRLSLSSHITSIIGKSLRNWDLSNIILLTSLLYVPLKSYIVVWLEAFWIMLPLCGILSMLFILIELNVCKKSLCIIFILNSIKTLSITTRKCAINLINHHFKKEQVFMTFSFFLKFLIP